MESYKEHNEKFYSWEYEEVVVDEIVSKKQRMKMV